MAITASAKKAIRSAARKRVFNLRRKTAISAVEKQIRRFVAEGKSDEARKLVPSAYKAIDKATKSHFINKNAAARMKSRLVLHINKKVSAAK